MPKKHPSNETKKSKLGGDLPGGPPTEAEIIRLAKDVSY